MFRIEQACKTFTELTEGQIHFSFDTIVWSLPQVRAGKLRAFGIAKSAAFKDCSGDTDDCRAEVFPASKA